MSDSAMDLREAVPVTINGEPHQAAAGTLQALLEEQGVAPDGRGVAVAVNGAVVPRARWAAMALTPGDDVEIVQAKQGG